MSEKGYDDCEHGLVERLLQLENLSKDKRDEEIDQILLLSTSCQYCHHDLEIQLDYALGDWPGFGLTQDQSWREKIEVFVTRQIHDTDQTRQAVQDLRKVWKTIRFQRDLGRLIKRTNRLVSLIGLFAPKEAILLQEIRLVQETIDQMSVEYGVKLVEVLLGYDPEEVKENWRKLVARV